MIEKILNHYNIGGINSVKKISEGLVNETYNINADDGVFILQKLNPIFGVEVISDMDNIFRYLKNRGWVVQEVIKNKNGKMFSEAEYGVWRLLAYVDGRVFSKVENGHIAYEAGRILGRFHKDMKEFNYDFKHIRPLHRATENLFEIFMNASKENDDSEIEELKRQILDIDKLILPKNLRYSITHGDPKIGNIVFSYEENPTAITMIDIDDCGSKHGPLVDLGDAFRSWCGLSEDDINVSFSLEFFKSALKGYRRGSGGFLFENEIALLPQAIKLITLELAMRFLTDYFLDNYFAYDSAKYPSRKAHNLARARGQLVLYNDVVNKEEAIIGVIDKIYSNF